jgi:cytochrome c biogenesis factor
MYIALFGLVRVNAVKGWAIQHGAVGTAAITGLFITGILAFVLYIVIANFWPSAAAANAAIQAATATDVGTTTSKTFFSMGLWFIVIGVFIALFILLISHIRGGKK